MVCLYDLFKRRAAAELDAEVLLQAGHAFQQSLERTRRTSS